MRNNKQFYIEGDDELTINDVLEVYKNVRRNRKS